MRHVGAEGGANRYKALPKFPRSAGQPWANIYNGPQHVIFGHHARRRLQVPAHAHPTLLKSNDWKRFSDSLHCSHSKDMGPLVPDAELLQSLQRTPLCCSCVPGTINILCSPLNAIPDLPSYHASDEQPCMPDKWSTFSWKALRSTWTNPIKCLLCSPAALRQASTPGVCWAIS